MPYLPEIVHAWMSFIREAILIALLAGGVSSASVFLAATLLSRLIVRLRRKRKKESCK